MATYTHDDNGESEYDRKKRKMAQRSKVITAEGKEIGSCPAVVNPKRRARCRDNLINFALTYLPGRFNKTFCKDHYLAAERLDRCSFGGGLFALAMPRASGKTALTEAAALRNVLYGIKKFIVMVQATATLAENSLMKIKRILESNDLLLEDFPEVCFPIRALERSNRKAQGQTMSGVPTQIEWGADRIILPTVPDSLASGAVIDVASLTGAIRGLSLPGPNGSMIRPDMVIVDDAQTRESAKSPTQTEDRATIITDDVLGLAGPGVPMSAVMLCTVIYPGDLSDKFLDREKKPQWRGMRTRMMISMPTNMALWDEYYEIRRQDMREELGVERSNQFYIDRFDAMNEGAEASWNERYEPDEVSAIQSAMNIYYSNPRGFAAEYQNDPNDMLGGAGCKINDAKHIARRTGIYRRYQVPDEATKLTAFIDCGGELLWYSIVAWDDHFNGWVIDYGSWPRQTRSFFAKSDPRPGLSGEYPTKDGIADGRADSEEERLHRGLYTLTKDILPVQYERPEGNGKPLMIERCLIDAGWNTETVVKFIKGSDYKRIIYPSKGFPRTSGQSWKQRPAEKVGYHWRYAMVEDSRAYQLQFDADTWKTFAFERLNVALGGNGVLVFFEGFHEMMGEHCAAEVGYPHEHKGLSWNNWELKPHRPDNDLWDTIVGNCVAASIQGVRFAATDAPPKPKLERTPPSAKHPGGQSQPITMEQLWKLKHQRRRG